jgi:hypothetical protein
MKRDIINTIQNKYLRKCNYYEKQLNKLYRDSGYARDIRQTGYYGFHIEYESLMMFYYKLSKMDELIDPMPFHARMKDVITSKHEKTSIYYKLYLNGISASELSDGSKLLSKSDISITIKQTTPYIVVKSIIEETFKIAL